MLPDLRPVAHIIGLLVAALGIAMLCPTVLDFVSGSDNWRPFLVSAMITAVTGATVATATANANSVTSGLDLRQAYVLTVGAWTTLSVFGGLPLMLGAPELSFTDAVFEGVSGITATGSTVITGLDNLPPGMNLWRGMMNWIGGLGIAFVAMIFLPVMRVGGMQFFRVQGFETFGKAMPRAADIARALLNVYAGLTALCIATYLAVGMEPLDAVVMGAASIATGGFSPTDASFGKYPGIAEYMGTLFMLLGALPYMRFVQLVNGAPLALMRDQQVRTLISWFAVAVAIVVAWRLITSDAGVEPTLRVALFNVASVMTGTGFGTGDFAVWGGFAMTVAFVVGLIGGCAGSSSGALTVFRVLVLFQAIARALHEIASPDRIVSLRYEGRVIDPDAVQGLVVYVYGFLFSLGIFSVAVSLTGVDVVSAIFAVWATVANVGYAYGPLTTPTGTFMDFPLAAKWLLILAMLMGRLGLLALFVLLLPRFWRG